MLESELQQRVIDLAHTFGWVVAHFRPAQTKHGWRTPVAADGAGFPDLVLVHPERQLVMFRELKSERGKLSPDQEAWRDRLVAAGADWELWRPSDLDHITHHLSFGRARIIC